jgi:hypothetical protein
MQTLFPPSSPPLTNIQPLDDHTVTKDVTLLNGPSKTPFLILRFINLTVPSDAAPSAKLRVENLHYELTEEDLDVRHTHNLLVWQTLIGTTGPI